MPVRPLALLALLLLLAGCLGPQSQTSLNSQTMEAKPELVVRPEEPAKPGPLRLGSHQALVEAFLAKTNSATQLERLENLRAWQELFGGYLKEAYSLELQTEETIRAEFEAFSSAYESRCRAKLPGEECAQAIERAQVFVDVGMVYRSAVLKVEEQPVQADGGERVLVTLDSFRQAFLLSPLDGAYKIVDVDNGMLLSDERPLEKVQAWAGERLGSVRQATQAENVRLDKILSDRCYYIRFLKTERSANTLVNREFGVVRNYQECYYEEYLKRASLSADPSVCEGMVDPDYYGQCVGAAAATLGDYAACDQARQETYPSTGPYGELSTRDVCFGKFVQSRINLRREDLITVCNRVGNPAYLQELKNKRFCPFG